MIFTTSDDISVSVTSTVGMRLQERLVYSDPSLGLLYNVHLGTACGLNKHHTAQLSAALSNTLTRATMLGQTNKYISS